MTGLIRHADAAHLSGQRLALARGGEDRNVVIFLGQFARGCGSRAAASREAPRTGKTVKNESSAFNYLILIPTPATQR